MVFFSGVFGCFLLFFWFFLFDRQSRVLLGTSFELLFYTHHLYQLSSTSMCIFLGVCPKSHQEIRIWHHLMYISSHVSPSSQKSACNQIFIILTSKASVLLVVGLCVAVLLHLHLHFFFIFIVFLVFLFLFLFLFLIMFLCLIRFRFRCFFFSFSFSFLLTPRFSRFNFLKRLGQKL